MKKRITVILLAVLLVTAGTVFASDSPFAEENFGATVYLTTDYVSRGISVSDENPALQATFDYFNPVGIFAGIWASSWHSAEASNDLELGYYAGYAGGLGNIFYTLSANYYVYPGADDDDAEWDYWEFVGTAGYTFDQVSLSPTVGVAYVYSPDYSGEDGNLHYGNASLDLVLPRNFGLGFEVGYFDLEGDSTTGQGFGLGGGDGYDYFHWRVGISTTLVGFGLDLSYHDTSESGSLGDIGYSADERLVFTLSRSI